MEIVVKKWEHFNRELGIYISNKRQYFNELARRGLVPYEEGCKLAESKRKESTWIPSHDLKNMVRELYDKKKEKIVLSQHPRLVDGMKKLGMKFDKGDTNAVNEKG